MHETAYAKINLALHVRAREPDGYHRIDTLFAFAEDGDQLGAEACDHLELKVTGLFAAQLGNGGDNLVMRAAAALKERFHVEHGARITLDKRLPIASGIGGGSADAAATLRLLVRLWGLSATEAELLDLAGGLGADVPACLLSRTTRGEGRGDQLAIVEDRRLAGRPILLVNPLVPVSTAAVFRGWDGIDRGPLGDAFEGRNDLEPPARAIAPVIDDVLEALSIAPFARMSGSGATCFALFDDAAERDRCALEVTRGAPHWWTLRSTIR